MISIKGATGFAKHAINRLVILMNNCYQTADTQGSLFIYRNICS